MTDAATTLAEEIKARHRCAQDLGSFHDRPRFCWECGESFDSDGDGEPVESWPCDAVRAADMLLELARPTCDCCGDWLTCSRSNEADHRLDAARNATQEKP